MTPTPPSSTKKRSAARSSSRLRGESMRARAATLIFAASFASSLLCAQALEDGVGAWDRTALALPIAIGGSAVLLHDPGQLIYQHSWRELG